MSTTRSDPNVRQGLLALVLALWLVACMPEGEARLAPAAGAAATVTPARATPALATEPALLAELPEAARNATGRGEPRGSGYWRVWNGCAPENRAQAAAANGGRAAGWIIMDDLLADPGIQLGNHPVTSCAQGLALLQAGSAGTRAEDAVAGLAALLLTAELNLNAGAESCPIAQEAVVAAHIILDELGFAGAGEGVAPASPEVADAIPQVQTLLAAYNRGDLCR